MVETGEQLKEIEVEMFEERAAVREFCGKNIGGSRMSTDEGTALKSICDLCERLRQRYALMRDAVQIELGYAELEHDNGRAERIRKNLLTAERDMDSANGMAK